MVPAGGGGKGAAMKKVKTWVVVADGTHARVFLSEGRGSGLKPVEGERFEIHVPPTRELGTDRPGRSFSAAHGKPHALGPKADLHRLEKQNFVRSVARIIDDAARTNAFDRLVLVLPPQALGDLRATLGPQARERVVAEIAKDLTHVPVHELASHLEGHLAA